MYLGRIRSSRCYCLTFCVRRVSAPYRHGTHYISKSGPVQSQVLAGSRQDRTAKHRPMGFPIIRTGMLRPTRQNVATTRRYVGCNIATGNSTVNGMCRSEVWGARRVCQVKGHHHHRHRRQQHSQWHMQVRVWRARRLRQVKSHHHHRLNKPYFRPYALGFRP